MSQVQSLSVVVPGDTCINNCKFCVSRMNESSKDYEDMVSGRNLYWDLYKQDMKERLKYAKEKGCDTVMLTGDIEPQQNWNFLKMFGNINSSLDNPFYNIEMQTTGVKLDNDYLYFLRHSVGVKTISLSISAFNDAENNEIIQTACSDNIKLKELCKKIKKYRFNLRLSINLTECFETLNPESIFKTAKEDYLADQITFRVLYTTEEDSAYTYLKNPDKYTKQDEWILKNRASDETLDELKWYIKRNGRALEKLDFGATKYSVNGMSTVLDEDCMSEEEKQALKYMILRPNCKLYSKWDDTGSLIF